MIICANDLKMTEAEGLSYSDAEWLNANVVLVTLPEGDTWHLKDDEISPEISVVL